MNKQLNVKNVPVTAMSREEMSSTFGGGLIDIVVRYVELGVTYFYNMGITESKRYRTQVK
jgi:hypothetical protein